MQVIVVKDSHEGGKKAFEIIEKMMKEDEVNCIGLATGSTPITLYQEMVNSSLDFSDKVSVNLDEYCGLEENHPQSYHYFMQEHLLNHKPFKKSYVPDGMKDPDEAIKEYDDILENCPIDIQILGIGENGHVGFNEPGTSFAAKTHLAELSESTIEANSRFFNGNEEVPKTAITMGIKSICDAKAIVLLAYGKSKAEAIAATVEGPVTEEVPASSLQNHPNIFVIIDEDAAAKLK
ncbi:MAG: glucosamine-6-phosphate deaminase [Atopococcus tabaci]|uniref:Glucosamine-6-phosphate deaminase n=1 Tax=Atopococcus tabaci TaxID=269774 RepID=A0AA43UCA4_9LACT|nr:glucosamine-6-phosphate deaminase [Atopococcus tabaci]